MKDKYRINQSICVLRQGFWKTDLFIYVHENERISES